MIISLSTVIILTSLVVVTGYTGQLSLCQFALAGIGAYVAGRLVAAHHFPFVVALLIALVVAIAAGLVVALPALRSHGSNLAVATLLLAFAIEALVFDSASLTGGDLGTQVTNVKLFGIPMDAINKPAHVLPGDLGLRGGSGAGRRQPAPERDGAAAAGGPVQRARRRRLGHPDRAHEGPGFHDRQRPGGSGRRAVRLLQLDHRVLDLHGPGLGQHGRLHHCRGRRLRHRPLLGRRCSRVGSAPTWASCSAPTCRTTCC